MVRADTVNSKTKIRKKFETFWNDKDLITFFTLHYLAKLFLNDFAYVVGNGHKRDFVINNVVILAISVQFNDILHDIDDKTMWEFLLFFMTKKSQMFLVFLYLVL